MTLERNETRLERNETHLERNETRLARNKTRGGNLHLGGTVHVSPIKSAFVGLSGPTNADFSFTLILINNKLSFVVSWYYLIIYITLFIYFVLIIFICCSVFKGGWLPMKYLMHHHPC